MGTYDNKSDDLNKVLRRTPSGDDRQSLSDALMGINIFDAKLPPPREKYGPVYVFFTRPQLNLTKMNISRDRRFSTLMTESDNTIHAYVRQLLDPRLHAQAEGKENYEEVPLVDGNAKKGEDYVNNPLLNNELPFISIFTNCFKSISGFPDQVLDTWVSSKGMRKDEWGYGEGETRVFYNFDLTVTFESVQEGAIELINDFWLDYISNIGKGVFVPYNDMRIRRETDYDTGIYVMVMAENGRNIKHIAKTIGIPITNNKGKLFDVTKGQSKNTDTGEYAMRFKCFGAEYDDPILLKEFNDVIGMFNTDIRSMMYLGTPTDYVEVPNSLLPTVGNRAIPFIDLRYNTLEWLIHKDKLKYIKNETEETT